MTEQKQETASRNLTALFLSFSGFPDIQPGPDSSEIASLLGKCISFADQIIRLYGGKPDKYLGESVIAFFGLNGEGQRSSVNAIKSAIEMQHKFSVLKTEDNLPDSLGLKIGIFTGGIFIATIGSGAGQQENFFGEAIQLASHICSMATPGQILVGEETRKQVLNDFAFNVLEPVPVKGYKKPLAIYEVTVKKTEPSQPPLQSGRIITSGMVGRQKESRILEEQIKQLLNGRGARCASKGLPALANRG